TEAELSGWDHHCVAGHDVRVMVTGIGIRQSRTKLRELLKASTDMCIVTGTAGTLTNQNEIGSIVVARAVKADSENTVLPCDQRLVDAAMRSGATAVDYFCTSTAIVNSASGRSRLATI